MRKRKESKKITTKQESVTWFLDENLTSSGAGWLQGKKVETATTLDLKGVKDQLISTSLNKKFKDVIVVTANRRVDKTGDYFVAPNNNTGYVLFSAGLAGKSESVKIEYLKKFEGVVKNPKKLLGAVVTLTGTNIVYKKGRKKKIVKYTQFI